MCDDFIKRNKQLIFDLLIPVTYVYNELILFYKSGFEFESYRFAGIILSAAAIGFAIDFLSNLTKKENLNKWLHFVFAELITVFFTIEYFLDETYSSFMSIESITTGAGGVLASYKDMIFNIFAKGFDTILLFQIPSIIILVLCIIVKTYSNTKVSTLIVYIICFIFFLSMGNSSLINTPAYQAKYTYEYMFDDSVRTFGLFNSIHLDIKYAKEGVPKAPWTFIPTENTDIPIHEKNVLNVDWDELSASTSNKTIKSISNIISNSTPTTKNDYTGLFEGKNLILITAESFSKELIREDYFPLIYRMATEGIIVEDYYHPFWGGSTTSGEAAVLTGLIPLNGASTMQSVIGKNNDYTLAPFFSERGYSTAAYHNGTSIYYNRIKTHPALGFSKFYADGSGMEKYLLHGNWPKSDLDMFKFIADDLENYQNNFYAYVMTFSGHGIYNFAGHSIAAMNRSALKGDPLYNQAQIGGYIAANMDFEYGLEYLVEYLDKRGILNDTVFVITNDHYPYALQNGSAWLNNRNYLEDLYGYYPYTQPERDHNALIIWTPDLGTQEKIVVSDPCYAPDILPTVLNLFGMEYESRIYSGRDILSSSSGLVIWANSSWMTNKGYYDSTTGKFTPNEGVEINESYINKCKQVVRDKMSVARSFISTDFYKYYSNCIADDDE